MSLLRSFFDTVVGCEPAEGTAPTDGAAPTATPTAPQTEKDAIAKVDQHVSPKDCFIWFMDSKRGYEPIGGTGCAHWVAHQKGWTGGKPGSNGCNKNYLIRVPDIVRQSGSEVAPANVQLGNVWVDDNVGHCGMVSKVDPPADPENDPNPTIEIEHCSSGQGKVAKNDWASYFKGGGKFYQG